jgi:7-carboxy-7-deazaguanine synthase
MYIKEIFHSFQGEGPWIGYPQIFIRFYGCNIHCPYCDEPDFIEDRKTHTVESVLEILKPLLAKPTHSISITGGEPLIQFKAIQELLPHLPLPAYLETNGTLPQHLNEVKDLFTYFAVDYKPGFQKEFTEFMECLRDKSNVFVKYVLLRDFSIQDMQHITKIMSAINPAIPLVIQPVTPFAEIKQKAKVEDIERAYNLAAKHLKDVRIIPQTHKFMGVR